MAKIGLPKGSGKRLKVCEKSGNFEMDIEWQPWIIFLSDSLNICFGLIKNRLKNHLIETV